MMAVPTEWMEGAKQLGIPVALAIAGYYVLPKLWLWVQQRTNINGQQNDLAAAGLTGMNEVVTALRSQIADFRAQLTDMNARLKEMEQTLKKAYDDKLSAEQGEAIAKNDLFNARLYIKKLIAQIKSLGATPVDE